MPNVNTGYTEAWDFAGQVRRNSLNSKALFDSLSPLDQLYSDYLMISADKAVFVQAHYLPDNRRIYVNMVSSVNVPGGPRPDCAPNELFGSTMDLYIRRMTLGGADNWILNADNPQMIITLPGVYRLELEDLDMLGHDLRVDYYAWDIGRAVPAFPVMR